MWTVTFSNYIFLCSLHRHAPCFSCDSRIITWHLFPTESWNVWKFQVSLLFICLTVKRWKMGLLRNPALIWCATYTSSSSSFFKDAGRPFSCGVIQRDSLVADRGHSRRGKRLRDLTAVRKKGDRIESEFRHQSDTCCRRDPILIFRIYYKLYKYIYNI